MCTEPFRCYRYYLLSLQLQNSHWTCGAVRVLNLDLARFNAFYIECWRIIDIFPFYCQYLKVSKKKLSTADCPYIVMNINYCLLFTTPFECVRQ